MEYLSGLSFLRKSLKACRPETQHAPWVRPSLWVGLGAVRLAHPSTALSRCTSGPVPAPHWPYLGLLRASREGQGQLLTRMLGSLSECLARVMASSVTRVSPLAWISSTAI